MSMIISASYKTDIPTFYGEWFMNRLDAGYCMVINPYNRRPFRVSLRLEDAKAIVFWTKNAGPFLPKLTLIRERGYPFVLQYTINAYPRALEQSVVNAEQSIEHMKKIAAEFGPQVGVWRYDTILFTTLTPPDFHRRNFERLAKALEGTTNEVVVSFAQFYKKTLRNMNSAAETNRFTWYDPDDNAKRSLVDELADVARAYGIQLSICSQRRFISDRVAEARCIDAARISKIIGHPLSVELKGNRAECGCYASRDIGEYDTCPHGCVYCYAVLNQALAQKHYREHEPSSEYLFAPADLSLQVDDDHDDDSDTAQLKLL